MQPKDKLKKKKRHLPKVKQWSQDSNPGQYDSKSKLLTTPPYSLGNDRAWWLYWCNIFSIKNITCLYSLSITTTWGRKDHLHIENEKAEIQKVLWLGQSHTALKCWSWDTNQGCATSKFEIFATWGPFKIARVQMPLQTNWITTSWGGTQVWIVFETPQVTLPVQTSLGTTALRSNPSHPTYFLFYSMAPTGG